MTAVAAPTTSVRGAPVTSHLGAGIEENPYADGTYPPDGEPVSSSR
ncbi:hypothetical protein [Rhodococcus triatomae]